MFTLISNNDSTIQLGGSQHSGGSHLRKSNEKFSHNPKNFVFSDYILSLVIENNVSETL